MLPLVLVELVKFHRFQFVESVVLKLTDLVGFDRRSGDLDVLVVVGMHVLVDVNHVVVLLKGVLV